MDLPAALRNASDAQIVFDIDAQNQMQPNDIIRVRDSVTVDGTLALNVAPLLPLKYDLISAASLASTTTIGNTLVFDWNNAVRGATLSATVDADFALGGRYLTSQQGAKAGYLQSVWDAGGANLASVFGYLHQFQAGDYSDYQSVLQRIAGGVLNSQTIELKTTFATCLTDSLSCPLMTGQGWRLRQTGCSWGRLTGNIVEQSSNTSNTGYHVTAGGIRLGAQKPFGNQWTAGVTIGYGNNYMTSDGFSSNGQFFDMSASLQKQVDDWTFGASFGFAQGWLQNNRSLSLPSNGPAQSISGLYTSRSRITMAGLKLRAAYTHDQGHYYLKPYVDLDLVYASQSGYSESGGILALKAESGSQFNVAVTPMLELGTDLAVDGKRRIKGFVSVGASFLPNNQVTTHMSLGNLATNVGTYGVSTDGPTVLGHLNLGLQAYESDNLEVRAQYGLQVGDGYWSQSLSANLVYRF
ncbi:hypothetical protein DBV39_17255 [Orrella marina]|uniref:Autotransporter domain-containing protein n=2 Tax=Orrella marina TaxID=2163011 RepID=A0A2R4XN13_9BURK|nr:hypothetical protein DBV39_17255 [Orrella marina]